MKKSLYFFLAILTLSIFSCEKEKDLPLKEGKGMCFELVYPYSVIVDDAEEATTINSEEDLKAIYTSCKENGIEADESDNKEEFDFEEKYACFEYVFPLTISYKEGVTKVIQNDEDLWAAKKLCKGKKEHDCGDKDEEWEDKEESNDE